MTTDNTPAKQSPCFLFNLIKAYLAGKSRKDAEKMACTLEKKNTLRK